MNGDTLNDRIAWALNRAAHKLGKPTDLYRASGYSDPLDSTNRILKMPAAFVPAAADSASVPEVMSLTWRAILDTSYVEAGDYLRQQQRVWVVAERYDLLPCGCLLTNDVVTITRYHVDGSQRIEPILERWPVCIWSSHDASRPSADLPTDIPGATWNMILSAKAGGVVRNTDRIIDGRGQHGIVTNVEQSPLGWKVVAKQVST